MSDCSSGHLELEASRNESGQPGMDPVTVDSSALAEEKLSPSESDRAKCTAHAETAESHGSEQMAWNDRCSIPTENSEMMTDRRERECPTAVKATPSTEVDTVLEPERKKMKSSDSDAVPTDLSDAGKNDSSVESKPLLESSRVEDQADADAGSSVEASQTVQQTGDMSATATSQELFSSESHDPAVSPVLFSSEEMAGTCEQEGDYVQPTETVFESCQMEDESYASYDNENLRPVPTEDLDFSKEPKLLAKATTEYNSVPENYLRGCMWSPDGSCLMTNSNDNLLRFYYFEDPETFEESTSPSELVPVLKIQEREQIYDYCWNPYIRMTPNKEDCFMLTSCRDMPIHLWNVCDGQLQATYRAYDDVDEVTSAYCLSVSWDGRSIYSGFNKSIRIFDTSRPGRCCEKRVTYGPLNHKQARHPVKGKMKKAGQPGIISCIALHPLDERFYAAGAYSSFIGLYPRNVDEPCLARLQGQRGGVTHLRFSPDGTKLYSGGRMDNEIICWDVRQLNSILCVFSADRLVNTNQRIYFDLDSTGQYLVSGSCDGQVMVWDTGQSPHLCLDGPKLDPVASYHLHNDAVNGVSLHPCLPFLATAAGQRHFPLPQTDASSGSGSDSDSSEEMASADFSLRLWKLHTVPLDPAAVPEDAGAHAQAASEASQLSAQQTDAGEDSAQADVSM